MTTATGVARQNARQIRRAAPSKAKKAQRLKGIVAILCAFAICLSIVTLSAFAANLKRVNNELQSDNEYLQAEIDSLNNEIGDSTNINTIESTATQKLNMVHPNSENYIAIEDKETENTDLASTIKEEAYE